jgi:uncharacterized damage-inducible protein DinB
MSKTCVCAVAVVVAIGATVASAQSQPSADSGYTASVRSRWNAVKRNLAASAQVMPDAGFSFKPTPDVRSFGELLGHLTNEHYIFCSQMKGEPNSHEKADFEKKTTKAEFVKDLNDSIAYCDAAYTAVKDDPATVAPFAPNRRDTPFSSMLLNVTHDSEHYGNIVTYLRLKGIVPPSSAPSR